MAAAVAVVAVDEGDPEQDGFGVERVVIHDRVAEDRTPRAFAGRFECDSPIRGAITWIRVPKLKADARCQDDLAGWLRRSVS